MPYYEFLIHLGNDRYRVESDEYPNLDEARKYAERLVKSKLQKKIVSVAISKHLDFFVRKG